MTILAIDPGPAQSAWLEFDDVGGHPSAFRIEANETVLNLIRLGSFRESSVAVIERFESFGMPVGREVFDTVYWSGRFHEAIETSGGRVEGLTRRVVKLHLCHSARAKDANVNQVLRDRFGGSAAKGTKAHPGPLYGISADAWAALAIAVAYTEGAR